MKRLHLTKILQNIHVSGIDERVHRNARWAGPALFFLLFSTWLMTHTMGYDSAEKNILIARTVWSDFGSHIPLIRSFSMGDNFDRLLSARAPEYPLFPGEPIRYHFLFYMVVGLLEKLGMRLDWALNIPSILGFTLLLLGIFFLSYRLFRSYPVAILSIIFFLFNGSLSFRKFFADHPLSLDTPLDILRANAFPAFGPWDGGQISAFWNLNIYTNQRHLALAFATGIFFILWIIRKADQVSTVNSKHQVPSTKQIQNANIQNTKRLKFGNWKLGFIWDLVLGIWDLRESLLWGFIIGMFPFFHQPMLLVFAVLLSWYFLSFPKLRILLLITGITASILIIPQFFSSSLFGVSSGVPLNLFEHWKLEIGHLKLFYWFPGYLIFDRLTVMNFLSFWFQNLGLHALLVPLGFFLIPKPARRVLLPLFILFVIGNLFKFSKEVAANHKFFNFALILGNMISAYIIVRFTQPFDHLTIQPLKIFMKCTGVIGLVGILTLSGFIDFFVIVNDTKGTLADVGRDQTATWIATNTPKDAVFLNSSFLYHPASLAGRKIFMGWPYFAWSAGYDTYKRNDEMKLLYESRDPGVFCPLLKQHYISYVTVQDTKDDHNLPTIDVSYFRDTYPTAFESSDGKLQIYQTSALCSDGPSQ